MKDLLVAIIQSMPLAAIILAIFFFKDIKQLLKNLYINSVTIAGVNLEVDNETIKELARFLTDAMNSAVTSEEWHVFSRIISSIDDPNKNTVSEILEWQLNRREDGVVQDDSTKKNLKMLRALRGFGLIVPQKKKDRWSNDSVIVVTPFGRYVADHPKLKRLIR